MSLHYLVQLEILITHVHRWVLTERNYIMRPCPSPPDYY